MGRRRSAVYDADVMCFGTLTKYYKLGSDLNVKTSAVAVYFWLQIQYYSKIMLSFRKIILMLHAYEARIDP